LSGRGARRDGRCARSVGWQSNEFCRDRNRTAGFEARH
jgi:hypothetical protein